MFTLLWQREEGNLTKLLFSNDFHGQLKVHRGTEMKDCEKASAIEQSLPQSVSQISPLNAKSQASPSDDVAIITKEPLKGNKHIAQELKSIRHIRTLVQIRFSSPLSSDLHDKTGKESPTSHKRRRADNRSGLKECAITGSEWLLDIGG